MSGNQISNRKPLKENQAENIVTPIKGESSVMFVPVMTAGCNWRREKTVITRRDDREQTHGRRNVGQRRTRAKVNVHQ